MIWWPKIVSIDKNITGAPEDFYSKRDFWGYENHVNCGDGVAGRYRVALSHDRRCDCIGGLLRCKGKWRPGVRHTKFPNGVLSHLVFNIGQDKLPVIRALEMSFKAVGLGVEEWVDSIYGSRISSGSRAGIYCRGRGTSESIPLDKFATVFQVALVWVSRHSGIKSNEAADQFARAGSETVGPELTVGIPCSLGGREISLWLREQHIASWRGDLADCIKALSNQEAVTRILTAYGILNYHSQKLDITSMLCDCPTYARTKLELLGSAFQASADRRFLG
ncbi:hypothetical protein ACFW04_004610 [Cataglyphis niger]